MSKTKETPAERQAKEFVANVTILDTNQIARWDRRFKANGQAQAMTINLWSGALGKLAQYYGVGIDGLPHTPPTKNIQLFTDVLRAGRATANFRSMYKVVKPFLPPTWRWSHATQELTAAKTKKAEKERKDFDYKAVAETLEKRFREELVKELTVELDKPKAPYDLEKAAKSFATRAKNNKVSLLDAARATIAAEIEAYGFTVPVEELFAELARPYLADAETQDRRNNAKTEAQRIDDEQVERAAEEARLATQEAANERAKDREARRPGSGANPTPGEAAQSRVEIDPGMDFVDEHSDSTAEIAE